MEVSGRHFTPHDLKEKSRAPFGCPALSVRSMDHGTAYKSGTSAGGQPHAGFIMPAAMGAPTAAGFASGLAVPVLAVHAWRTSDIESYFLWSLFLGWRCRLAWCLSSSILLGRARLDLRVPDGFYDVNPQDE